jgi:Protein of unknown function (DUF642)/Lectin C-type domain
MGRFLIFCLDPPNGFNVNHSHVSPLIVQRPSVIVSALTRTCHKRVMIQSVSAVLKPFVGALIILLPGSMLGQTQWPVSSGGNGHYYEVVTTQQPISWTDARDAAMARGGYLATITSAAEDAFVQNLAANSPIWLGGFQPAGSPEPAGGWRWVTGEPFTYTNWLAGEPSDNGQSPYGPENYLQAFFAYYGVWGWNDLSNYNPQAGNLKYVIEYDSLGARNLIVNGSFESPAFTNGDFGPGRQSFSSPSAGITGWTVGGTGNVFLHECPDIEAAGSTYCFAQNGANYLDLSGSGPPHATVYQDFPSTPGKSYVLSFYIGASNLTPPAPTINVQVTGATFLINETVTPVSPSTNINWSRQAFSFVANSNSTRLSFVDTSSADDNASFVDNVSVQEVLAGVDISYPHAATSWGENINSQYGIGSYIQDLWGGCGAFTSAPINISNIANPQSHFDPSRIAGYALINIDKQDIDTVCQPSPSPAKITQWTGQAQITKALAPLSANTLATLAFVAVDAEHLELPAPMLTADEAVARYADAIWQVWTKGIPAVIYTSREYWTWTQYLNNTSEIQPKPPLWDIPLWDADGPQYGEPIQTILQYNQYQANATLSGFTPPYGPWTDRQGRQYVIDSPPGHINKLNNVECDLDVFDPGIFTLPRPPLGCKPGFRIANPSVSRRQDGSIALRGSVFNDSPSVGHELCPALATRINSGIVQIGLTASSFQDSIKLGTIDVTAGTHKDFTIILPFPSSPPAGSIASVHLSLSCGGVSRSDFSFRVPLQ